MQQITTPLIGLITLVFIVMAVGFVATGSLTTPSDGEKSVLTCGVVTVVSEATCAASEEIVFLLLALLGSAGTAYTLAHVIRVVRRWRDPLYSYPYINRPAFSSLAEAFRRGLIHPTLYDSRA